MIEESHSLRPRNIKMASDSDSNSSAPMTPIRPTTTPAVNRSSPFLPTPLETLFLAVYPIILIFGTLFSAISPETRNAPFDVSRQAHVQSEAPSYFARKNNLFNVLFVKRGWLWITVAFFAFVATHPTFRDGRAAVRATTRWALVTGWWILVTQWCFGPALIDRGFRITGGKCVVAYEAMSTGTADPKEVFTAAACRSAGGSWSGGHDISGHVFLLVLGSCFLVHEVAWVVLRAGVKILDSGDDRSIVMGDGAVKDAATGSGRTPTAHERHLSAGGKFALGVVALSLWMLLMTAVYFHTWFEKFTGLLVASVAIYGIYISPRWIPALRGLVGLPGI
ncbi:inositol phospholipid synthesis and fat-storage-inducing TM-domain-containing protein [Xylaria sp. CBS 124048]|nr:inositol phospholipid synthesis and fat-storage-inducing TM-domain-containing protein [Xylaria sp. CBS 124048]